MFASSNILNVLQTEIVKYGQLENLKNFYNCHPSLGQLPPGAFSRCRKMTFGDLFNFLIYPRSKSTDIELLEYSHLIGKPNVNKSDFSRRRHAVPARYLYELNRSMVSSLYRLGRPALWKGHLVLAGDGTTYSLPNTARIREDYLQGRKTGRGEQALARGVVVKDVLNDIVVASGMECYGRDEISLLADEIGSLPQAVLELSPVLSLDRKFCAYTLLVSAMRLGISVIVRVKERFNKDVDEFIHSKDQACEVTLRPAPTTVKKLNRMYGKGSYEAFNVGLVRLPAGMVVMTTIPGGLSVAEADSLYHGRWDDETTIGFIKNCLQVEIFSGTSDNALRQDFHAKTIAYNILSALCQQAAMMRHDRGERRINRNVALGILRLNAVTVMTRVCNINSHCVRNVLTEVSRFTTAVIGNRHSPRAFRKIKHSGKYITLQNYRRAM